MSKLKIELGDVVSAFSSPGREPGEHEIGVRVRLDDPEQPLHEHLEWMRAELQSASELRALNAELVEALDLAKTYMTVGGAIKASWKLKEDCDKVDDVLTKARGRAMSGIPDYEVQLYLDHEHPDAMTTADRNALVDAVRWAERFMWSANTTDPEEGKWYLFYNGKHWEGAWSSDGSWWDEMGEELADHAECPHYKPMPPAPEDD